ncbi:MAG TPA: TetR/AcrR family transcriptional regulator [Acidimicrobiales bacterium]|nr:TetR/AcrR family transcriptional regulator [Acidimicrobiales bacterium]
MSASDGDDDGDADVRDIDGRHRRAERSRDAVVDALLSLYDDGVVRPGVADIAARAGVSPRSVFRHFADLEGLAEAAIDRQWARVHVLFEAPPHEGDRETRVTALVDQRLRLHGAIIGVARAAAVLSSSSPVVASTLRARRRLLGDQVVALFAPELRARQGQARSELAAALEATASLENVEYLRAHAGLGSDRAAGVVRRMLHALLAAP